MAFGIAQLSSDLFPVAIPSQGPEPFAPSPLYEANRRAWIAAVSEPAHMGNGVRVTEFSPHDVTLTETFSDGVRVSMITEWRYSSFAKKGSGLF